ncbi:MAG: FixH family protein [Pseudomonadota bacterium]|nr:FixH family protein [Pseudomonadota bacterium]
MSIQQKSNEDIQPWYRQFWPWFIMTPPAIAVVAGLTTVYIAAKDPDALVMDRYAKVGLAVERNLAQEQSARERGINAQLVLNRSDGHISARITGEAPPPDQLRVYFSHPTLAERDIDLLLDRDSRGIYTASTGQDLAGRWYVRLGVPDGQWRLDGELQAEANQLSLTAGNP